MTTDERISALETSLDALSTTQADLRSQLRQARVDRWQDRIDDLELQIRLGVAEGGDRVTRASTTLHHTWNQARTQLLDASTEAGVAAESLHERLRNAYDDARAALIDTKNDLTR